MKWPKMPALQPRERLLAVGCGVVLTIVAMDRLILGPWTTHARATRQEIRQMEQALQSHQRVLARRQRVMAELQRYQRYLLPTIADDLQKAALVTEIQTLAGDSHITLGEVQPLAAESGQTTTRYPMELRFVCTLEEWVEFLYRLETSPSLYEIVRAGLAVHESEPDRLTGYLRIVSASLHGAASTQPPDAEGVAHAAPPTP